MLEFILSVLSFLPIPEDPMNYKLKDATYDYGPNPWQTMDVYNEHGDGDVFVVICLSAYAESNKPAFISDQMPNVLPRFAHLLVEGEDVVVYFVQVTVANETPSVPGFLTPDMVPAFGPTPVSMGDVLTAVDFIHETNPGKKIVLSGDSAAGETVVWATSNIPILRLQVAGVIATRSPFFWNELEPDITGRKFQSKAFPGETAATLRDTDEEHRAFFSMTYHPDMPPTYVAYNDPPDWSNGHTCLSGAMLKDIYDGPIDPDEDTPVVRFVLYSPGMPGGGGLGGAVPGPFLVGLPHEPDALLLDEPGTPSLKANDTLMMDMLDWMGDVVL